jgi:hypothetical protein
LWFGLVLTPASAPQTQAAGLPLPARVFVQTDGIGDPDELAARRASVKDLTAALAGKRKTAVIAVSEDRADIVVDVLSRALMVPRVVMGLGARPGQPSSTGPVRTAVLRVRLTFEDDSIVFTNKNKPAESARGWKNAADDIGDQIEAWIAKRRDAAGTVPDRPVGR